MRQVYNAARFLEICLDECGWEYITISIAPSILMDLSLSKYILNAFICRQVSRNVQHYRPPYIHQRNPPRCTRRVKPPAWRGGSATKIDQTKLRQTDGRTDRQTAVQTETLSRSPDHPTPLHTRKQQSTLCACVRVRARVRFNPPPFS